MLSSKFQSHSIKNEDFKVNPVKPFNPIRTKGGEWKLLTYYKDCHIIRPRVIA